jgi:redox-sensitive bicupin YhaK (pirin superfamily)
MFASRLSKGTQVRHQFGEGRGGYLYVIDGALRANGEHMTPGDAAYVLGAGELALRGEQESDLILVDTPL